MKTWASMKWNGIRMRIFVPMLLILLIFPIGCTLALGVSSRWFLENSVQWDIGRTLQQLKKGELTDWDDPKLDRSIGILVLDAENRLLYQSPAERIGKQERSESSSAADRRGETEDKSKTALENAENDQSTANAVSENRGSNQSTANAVSENIGSDQNSIRATLENAGSSQRIAEEIIDQWTELKEKNSKKTEDKEPMPEGEEGEKKRGLSVWLKTVGDSVYAISDWELPKEKETIGSLSELSKAPHGLISRLGEEASVILLYKRVPDGYLILRQMGWWILCITVFFLMLSFLLLWHITRSLEKPIEDLYRRTLTTTEENNGFMGEEYSVTELEQLRKAFSAMQERIAENQREKQRIFMNMSHDLRTPLASIIGYAQGIETGIMGQPEQAARVILREGRRMERMVEECMLLSRLDSKSYPENKQLLELTAFLKEELEALRSIDRRKEILFVSETMEGPLGNGKGAEKRLKAAGKSSEATEAAMAEMPVMEVASAEAGKLLLYCDPDLLGRILQNVIANGLRYAESRVIVSVETVGVELLIRIEDDGPGISDTELPHIFERGYKGSHGKFGIGLSIVQYGMEYMKGRAEVTVKQPPEHGCVYSLYFPRA